MLREFICSHKVLFFFFLLPEQHFTEVVGSEEFLNLGMEQVSSLIASDKLTIPTEEKVRTHSPCSPYSGRTTRPNDCT